TEGGPDVDAAITFDDLRGLLGRRGVTVQEQPGYFSRVPEERRRHWSTAGGLPLEVLMEETHASRRFRKVPGLGSPQAMARAAAGAVDGIVEEIGLAPNGKPWDCGACGYVTCRAFAEAAAVGRTTLKSCPPYLDKVAKHAQLQAAVDGLTTLATYRVLRDRLASAVARSGRTGDPFAVLFVALH